MKTLAIIGAGTAGTMMANHLTSELDRREWKIVMIDERREHHYQPGYLFIPFELYDPDTIRKPIQQFIPDGVEFINKHIERIVPEKNTIQMESGNEIEYDVLIIASGCKIAPEETTGMKGSLWHKKVFDFYTLEGAVALRDTLKSWAGGHLVIHITEMPIKCPVAPLEFAFLADAFFRSKHMRDKVKISYVTPLSGAFTKPKATAALEHLLAEKGIDIVADFAIEQVDNDRQCVIDYGGREVSFDLLVTIPTNKGDALIERSGMGDELNFVPTNKQTLQSEKYSNVFVLGDATNLPASKAGSVAHFEAEILKKNILRFIANQELLREFDGHANCFIETGNKKALLIDFNYTNEPETGKFPFESIGPMQLLRESRVNHMGKMAFRWVYWNMLLKARHIPFVSATMKPRNATVQHTTEHVSP